MILFRRDPTYTAKVISQEAEFYQVNGKGFYSHFKKVLKDMKIFANSRNKFMDNRLKQMQFIIEYSLLKHDKNLLLSNSK